MGKLDLELRFQEACSMKETLAKTDSILLRIFAGETIPKYEVVDVLGDMQLLQEYHTALIGRTSDELGHFQP